MGLQAIRYDQISSTKINEEVTNLLRALDGICAGLEDWEQIRGFIKASLQRLTEGELNPFLLQEVRGEVLDALHARLGSGPKWPVIRNRALNTFGNKGLGRHLT